MREKEIDPFGVGADFFHQTGDLHGTTGATIKLWLVRAGYGVIEKASIVVSYTDGVGFSRPASIEEESSNPESTLTQNSGHTLVRSCEN
jgi:hypothetical protein